LLFLLFLDINSRRTQARERREREHSKQSIENTLNPTGKVILLGKRRRRQTGIERGCLTEKNDSRKERTGSESASTSILKSLCVSGGEKELEISSPVCVLLHSFQSLSLLSFQTNFNG